MKRPALILALIVALAPTATFADCPADLAKLNLPSKNVSDDDSTTISPRAKLLLKQANTAIASNDEKTCVDMVKGLKVVMGAAG